MSPVYRFGDEHVRRKHFYMPCAIGPEFEEASEEEQARILKATYWADYISTSEWEALLGHEGCSPSAKSRLKKKAAGWIVALGRIASLNPDLFLASVEQALRVYGEQTKTEYPSGWIAGSVMHLDQLRETLSDYGAGVVTVRIEPPFEDDVAERGD